MWLYQAASRWCFVIDKRIMIDVIKTKCEKWWIPRKKIIHYQRIIINQQNQRHWEL